MTSIKKNTKPETKEDKKSRLRAKEFQEAFRKSVKLWKDKQDSYSTDIDKTDHEA